VVLRLGRARAALAQKLAGVPVFAPAYAENDDRAGMHFRLDYYAQPERGALPAWRNQMAEVSWLYWLRFDGLDAAARVDTATLFVHADGCAFPEHVKTVHSRLRGPKRLVWTEGNQIDFYDQAPQVGAAVEAAKAWFDETLRA
jgi:uncharacterized protein